MNRAEILARYDRLRKTIELYGMRREVTPYGACPIDPDGAGMILFADLNDASVKTAIHAQIAHFTNAGQPFEWVVYQHDRPADLIARLAAHGFDIDEPEAIMVLDIAHAPQSLLQPVDHNVRRITSPDKIDDVIAIREQVFQRDFSATAKTLRTRLTEARVCEWNGYSAASWPHQNSAVSAPTGEQPCPKRLMSSLSVAELWAAPLLLS